MMCMRNVEMQLRDIILECGRVSGITIDGDTNLQEDLGYNSLKLMDMVIHIEETFSVEITDEYLLLENLSVYKNLLDVVKRLVKGNESK